MWRHEAVRSINRIVDADSVDELFSGTRDESVRLCSILLDLASGANRHGRVAETVAKRRGLSAQYIEDRAKVLLDSAEELGRRDAYRILGLPPLAPAQVIRDRWRQLARELHPDARGDEAGLGDFLVIKRAYEVLSDPVRRHAYEEQWRQTVGIMEEARDAVRAGRPQPPRWSKLWGAPTGRQEPAERGGGENGGWPGDRRWQQVMGDLNSFMASWKRLEDRLTCGLRREVRLPEPGGASGFLALATSLESALAGLRIEELDEIERQAQRLLFPLTRARDGLEALRTLKRMLGDSPA